MYLITWMVDCCSVDALEGKREIEEFACRCRGLMDGGRIVVGVILLRMLMFVPLYMLMFGLVDDDLIRLALPSSPCLELF